jgi:hypothetical protein
MPSAKVTLNGKVIAESDKTIIVEGNHYFPPESISAEFFAENDRHTTCHWKGVADYFDLNVTAKNPAALRGPTASRPARLSASRTMWRSTTTRSTPSLSSFPPGLRAENDQRAGPRTIERGAPTSVRLSLFA